MLCEGLNFLTCVREHEIVTTRIWGGRKEGRVLLASSVASVFSPPGFG